MGAMTAPALRIINTRFGPAIEPQDLQAAALQPATGGRRSIPTGPEGSPGTDAQAPVHVGEGPGAPQKRHEWGPPVRTQFTTHRLCPNCGLLRITRHEPGHWPWTEWQRNGKRIQSDSTPACERVEVAALPERYAP